MTVLGSSRRGFTLVELLTVIAIIAILAAIIFPIFATLRKQVSKTSCITNLHSIGQAVKMYKDDYGVYPEALYGFVLPSSPPVARTFLFPQYIKDRVGFRCPMNPERSTDVTPERLVEGFNGVNGNPMGRRYFAWDSYDGTRVPHTVQTSRYFVHYLRKWDPRRLGMNEGENPRQLIFRYPPDTTVITWCTYHRGYVGDGSIEQGSQDLVLYLDGRARATPATLTATDVLAHQVAPGT